MKNARLTAGVGVLAITLLCGFKIDLKKALEKVAEQQKAAQKPAQKTEANRAPASIPDATPVGGVCDSSAGIGLCYTFTGAKTNEGKSQKGNQMACKFMRGKFTANTPCPATNRIGRCTVVPGTPDEYVLAYYSGKFDAGKAAQDCANAKSSIHRHGAGTWVAN